MYMQPRDWRKDPVSRSERICKQISVSSLPSELKSRYNWHRNNASDHACPYCHRKGTLKALTYIKKETIYNIYKNGKREEDVSYYTMFFRCTAKHASEVDYGYYTRFPHANLTYVAWKMVENTTDGDFLKKIGIL